MNIDPRDGVWTGRFEFVLYLDRFESDWFISIRLYFPLFSDRYLLFEGAKPHDLDEFTPQRWPMRPQVVSPEESARPENIV